MHKCCACLKIETPLYHGFHKAPNWELGLFGGGVSTLPPTIAELFTKFVCIFYASPKMTFLPHLAQLGNFNYA